jgi:hypothetical protein
MTLHDIIIRAARFIGTFLAALVVAVLPFALHIAPQSGVLFDSITTFIAVFVVTGLIGGLTFGFLAAPATIGAYFLSIAWLEHIHLIGIRGDGNDGELFYLLALFATASSFAAALVGATLRWTGIWQIATARWRGRRGDPPRAPPNKSLERTRER